MGVLLDTSILIGAERRLINFEQFLATLGNQTVAIAAITASELLHGCHRALSPAIKVRRFAFVEALLEQLPVVPFGLAEARMHARIWADVAAAGSPIGAHDLMIAATALHRGDVVATLNQRDFGRIPGLYLVPTPPSP